MNPALTTLARALTDATAPVTMDCVEALGKEYPFFTLPAVMMLRRGEAPADPSARRALLARVALNAPDAETLFMLCDRDHPEWAGFYPAGETRAVTTDDVIATFLDTYGHSTPAEDALLEKLIFNPTPDYSALLAREEEESLPEAVDPADTSQDALINAFILEHKDAPATPAIHVESPIGPAETPGTAPAETPETVEPVTAPAPAESSSLTESLAKIYIRQKRFDKAFEIIHTLSLNNPKKSAYFADQLRFLRKLMLARERNGQH